MSKFSVTIIGLGNIGMLYDFENNSNNVFLSHFKSLSADEIYVNRKNKFLRIGRNKGFIRNLDSQSTSFEGWTEQLAHWNNYLAVASVSGDVLLIDPVKIEADKRITTALGCKYLNVSKDGELWAACSDNGNSSIHQIDKDLNVIKSISLPSGLNLNQLAYLPGKDCFFTLVDGELMKFEPNTSSFNDWKKIEITRSVNLYGLGVNTENNNIFITDAKDYVSKGEVIVLDSAEVEITRLSTGVIPNGIVILD